MSHATPLSDDRLPHVMAALDLANHSAGDALVTLLRAAATVYVHGTRQSDALLENLVHGFRAEIRDQQSMLTVN